MAAEFNAGPSTSQSAKSAAYSAQDDNLLYRSLTYFFSGAGCRTIRATI
jgi:hypothetical protein